MTPVLDAVRREELRAKALAATPGPWTVGGGWTDHGSRWTGILSESADDVIGESGTASDADWAYIAAMSPHTTLVLLAYIAELETGPKVKPLEWTQHPTAKLWRSHSLLGIHRVYGMAVIGWAYDGYDGTEEKGATDTIEEARAAAQADYESRILAALLPKASVREERG